MSVRLLNVSNDISLELNELFTKIEYKIKVLIPTYADQWQLLRKKQKKS